MKYNGNAVFAPFNAGLYGIDEGDSDRSMQWSESKDAILDAFKREYETQIKDALDAAGLEYVGLEYYSPRFYNYETDSIDLELQVRDESKLRAALDKRKEKILEGMAANKSYDGYMALTAQNWDEVIDQYGDPDIIAIRAFLSGIDFDDATERIVYENLVYEYPCEHCDRIHAEYDNESEEDQKKIDACKIAHV